MSKNGVLKGAVFEVKMGVSCRKEKREKVEVFSIKYIWDKGLG
jgi:hypothetical protein